MLLMINNRIHYCFLGKSYLCPNNYPHTRQYIYTILFIKLLCVMQLTIIIMCICECCKETIRVGHQLGELFQRFLIATLQHGLTGK